jgi:hypothetical protein
LQTCPWKFRISYINALGFRLGPQKYFGPCNVVLGHRPATVRSNSGEPAAGTGQAQGGGRPAGSLGSILTGGWGGRGAGGVVQRRRPLLATVRPAPESSRPWQANGRRDRLQQWLGEGEDLLAGCGDTRRWELDGAGTHGAQRGAVPPRGKGTGPIYRRGASLCVPTAAEAGTGSKASTFALVAGGGRGGQTAGQQHARRTASSDAARGRGGRPAGAALGPGVAGPLRACTAAYDGEARRTRGAGARERGSTSRSDVACFGLPWFDCIYLKISQLKCTQ